jgi:hypothetical protein
METVRYFEVDDLPISAVGRSARIWFGSSSRPLPWSEVFLKATEISREEFDDLRALAAEFAA